MIDYEFVIKILHKEIIKTTNVINRILLCALITLRRGQYKAEHHFHYRDNCTMRKWFLTHWKARGEKLPVGAGEPRLFSSVCRGGLADATCLKNERVVYEHIFN